MCASKYKRKNKLFGQTQSFNNNKNCTLLKRENKETKYLIY